MLSRLVKIYKDISFKKKWRKLNKHNETAPKKIFNLNNVQVGKKTYGELDVIDWSDNVKLKIGNYCSIAPGVVFILGGEHPIHNITTYPFKVKCFGHEREAINKGDIVISDDVWIGLNSIIGSGVTIGRGAVIAAGSNVTKDVPPFTVVGGNPAKIIKNRFSKEIMDKLSSFEWSNSDFLNLDIDELYVELSETNVDNILENMKNKIK